MAKPEVKEEDKDFLYHIQEGDISNVTKCLESNPGEYFMSKKSFREVSVLFKNVDKGSDLKKNSIKLS